MVSKTNVNSKPKKKKKNYLNNKDLMPELLKSKAQGQMTDKFANMLQLLCLRYSKHPWFVNFSYIDDMQSYAMLMLVQNWQMFDETQYNNCFAYYTTCIKRSFLQYKQKEKKHQVLRDDLLIDSGLLPSNNYLVNFEENMHKDHYDSETYSDKVD